MTTVDKSRRTALRRRTGVVTFGSLCPDRLSLSETVWAFGNVTEKNARLFLEFLE